MPKKRIHKVVEKKSVKHVILHVVNNLKRFFVNIQDDKNIFGQVKNSARKSYKKTTVFIKKRPLGSFFIVLGLLFFVLIIGNIFHRQEEALAPESVTKEVKVFSIGNAPKASFQAKIEKQGVVKIVAQTGGIIQSVNVTEGQYVGQGQTLVVLSSNYQGGNAPAVQRQIAQANYQHLLDTYDQQKELIQKQRDIANLTDENADKQRDIAKQSLDATNALIDANQSVIDYFKSVAVTPEDDAAINQLQGVQNQFRDGARNLNYSQSGDNAPAKVSDTQKDIAIKQLDLQEKGLALSKEISRLQLSLAYISEATMYPASPFAGIIERINVSVGQSVSPGTVIATVSSDDIATTAVLSVPEKISKIILSGEPSELIIEGKAVAVMPYHVSTQATDGQLYTVFYDIPSEYQSSVTSNSFVSINVPIAPAEIVRALDPFIPVDAVYQSQDKA
ncbi:MAG TPA: biotin/lipoyl-binding protein, partial [Patescibacteria group bacterium]|nr:biotin/lipoyl-binding protein [Patescibacteria group bacterium]